MLSFGLIRSEKKLSVEPVFALAEEESERSAVESGWTVLLITLEPLTDKFDKASSKYHKINKTEDYRMHFEKLSFI